MRRASGPLTMPVGPSVLGRLMTVAAIVMGLVPIMWSKGAGASVMERIAAPMIGGMASATLLTLFILPVAYGLILQRRGAREERAAEAHRAAEELPAAESRSPASE